MLLDCCRIYGEAFSPTFIGDTMWRSLPEAGVLLVKDDCALMARYERSARSRWELPSGLVDAGETFEQAAERESLEETGVAVSITTLFCVAVMEVASADYCGSNLSYRAVALSDVAPHRARRRSGPLQGPTWTRA